VRDSCSVCDHPEHEQLNIALLDGLALRKIETVYPDVKRSSLSRHKRFCLPGITAAALQKAGSAEVKLAAEPSSVQGRAEEMSSASRLAILQALSRKDYRTAFQGMREHRGYVEMIGKATGELFPERGAPDRVPMFILPPGTHVNFSATVAQPRALTDNPTPSGRVVEAEAEQE